MPNGFVRALTSASLKASPLLGLVCRLELLWTQCAGAAHTNVHLRTITTCCFCSLSLARLCLLLNPLIRHHSPAQQYAPSTLSLSSSLQSPTCSFKPHSQLSSSRRSYTSAAAARQLNWSGSSRTSSTQPVRLSSAQLLGAQQTAVSPLQSSRAHLSLLMNLPDCSSGNQKLARDLPSIRPSLWPATGPI